MFECENYIPRQEQRGIRGLLMNTHLDFFDLGAFILNK